MLERIYCHLLMAPKFIAWLGGLCFSAAIALTALGLGRGQLARVLRRTERAELDEPRTLWWWLGLLQPETFIGWALVVGLAVVGATLLRIATSGRSL